MMQAREGEVQCMLMNIYLHSYVSMCAVEYVCLRMVRKSKSNLPVQLKKYILEVRLK